MGKKNLTAVGSSLNGSDGPSRPGCTAPTCEVFDGRTACKRGRKRRPASLWSFRCCTLTIFHDSLLQQGHQRTRRGLWYSAGPPLCSGRVLLRNRFQRGGGESWLKHGAILRLVIESEWACDENTSMNFLPYFFLSMPYVLSHSTVRVERIENEHSIF